MSFQAYLDNIQAKTGKTPEDFQQIAHEKGLLLDGKIPAGVKAGQIVAWLNFNAGLRLGFYLF